MSVVAFSDGLARVYATQLLFHYWPHLQPSFQIEHAVKKNCCELLFEFKFMISVPFKVCTAPLDNLRSAISFSRICNIVNLIYGIYVYTVFIVGNASLFLYLDGCAVACASCATKQTFARCRIFLEGTLFVIWIDDLRLFSKEIPCCEKFRWCLL